VEDLVFDEPVTVTICRFPWVYGGEAGGMPERLYTVERFDDPQDDGYLYVVENIHSVPEDVVYNSSTGAITFTTNVIPGNPTRGTGNHKWWVEDDPPGNP